MRLLRFIVLLSIFFVLMVSNASFAESENYCHNKEAWKEWDALVEKNPNDMELQALHALRIGLCVKVNRGGITLDQATEIFESARDAIIEKRKTDEARKENRHQL